MKTDGQSGVRCGEKNRTESEKFIYGKGNERQEEWGGGNGREVGCLRGIKL